MKPYPIVHFEIFGKCNGRCPHCITGTGNHPKGGAVDVETFFSCLKKLVELKLVDRDASTVYLYNWGEPFLHPDFCDIVAAVNELDLKYGISTNASVLPDMNSDVTRNLRIVMVSMPGFSQSSYDKIHGFQFEKIKENIITISEKLRETGCRGILRLLFHIYQFNLDELYECGKFAAKIGADFCPYYAGINDWYKAKSYLNKTLTYEELDKISRDIIMSPFLESIRKAAKKKCRMHDKYLVVNERGDIITCCKLPLDHPDILCGSVLHGDMEEILRKKLTQAVCRECLSLGLAYEDEMILKPDFYYKSLSAHRPSAGLKRFIPPWCRKLLRRIVPLR
ncbi:MAG: radical SAM protein [bacterium]